jgi:hypothetical protein
MADSAVPASPAIAKFAALRQAVLQNKLGRKLYRQDFLNACYDYADALRIRNQPDVVNLGEHVLEDCGKLKLVRDHIVDWVLLESEVDPSDEFGEALITMLEHLLELKSRPPEVNAWNDAWFEAHSVFVYETFLYITAALMRTGAYRILNLVLTNRYLLPETAGQGPSTFDTFGAFWGSSKTLQILAPEGRKLNAPAAELIKRQADRTDLPFEAVMQAELLVLMMAFITPECWWYPQTLLYSSRARAFPFFIRAAQHRSFLKLAEVTGISDANALKDAVRKGHDRLNVKSWHDFLMMGPSFVTIMNMDALDTL